jgi:hypothetical protein
MLRYAGPWYIIFHRTTLHLSVCNCFIQCYVRFIWCNNVSPRMETRGRQEREQGPREQHARGGATMHPTRCARGFCCFCAAVSCLLCPPFANGSPVCWAGFERRFLPPRTPTLECSFLSAAGDNLAIMAAPGSPVDLRTVLNLPTLGVPPESCSFKVRGWRGRWNTATLHASPITFRSFGR